jgi:hypothetical protein
MPGDLFGQVGMGGEDGYGAGPGCRSHSLDRVVPHVPIGEDPRQAGLERIWRSILSWPELFQGFVARGKVAAGKDEAVIIALQRSIQPVSVWRGSGEDKEGRGFERLHLSGHLVLQHQPLEPVLPRPSSTVVLVRNVTFGVSSSSSRPNAIEWAVREAPECSRVEVATWR